MTNIPKIFKKYEINPKKFLGQNFLINPATISKIIDEINPTNKDLVEIGPGLGALTNKLIKNANHLVAYEIDPEMVSVLNKELSTPNIEIIHTDFLDANFTWEKPRTIVGNIPYYITGKIIFKIFEAYQKFDRVVLMVQADVADKLTAKVNSKKYGKLTVACNYFGGFHKVFTVSKQDFYPIPSIDSAIVTLDFTSKSTVPNEWEFLKFLKLAFFARRKILLNNLKRQFDANKLAQAYAKLNLSEKIRPQELDIKLFVQLWKELTN